MEIARYPCSQPLFYRCAYTGWDSYLKYQTKLEAYSPRFTVQYGKDAIAEVDAAAAMPDFGVRTSRYQVLRIDLEAQGKVCTNLWKYLKSYIGEVFPENKQVIYWKAAGWNQYDGAIKHSWPDVETLMVNGLNFINDHLADLTANDVMPKDFSTKFKEAKDKFGTIYGDFLNAERTAQEQASGKISANNACYKKLMQMFSIATNVFADEPEVKKAFVFSEILLLVGGPGTSGFSGQVVDAISGIGIEGVSISIINRKESTLTNTDGRFEFLQVAAGPYELVFVKKGYVAERKNIDTSVGTVNQLGVITMQTEIIMEVARETVATEEVVETSMVSAETT